MASTSHGSLIGGAWGYGRGYGSESGRVGQQDVRGGWLGAIYGVPGGGGPANGKGVPCDPER